VSELAKQVFQCPLCLAEFFLEIEVAKSEVITCFHCQSKLITSNNGEKEIVLEEAPVIGEEYI
jgi:DNA-directed RNA polymerase subunit RPC12/RpoP